MPDAKVAVPSATLLEVPKSCQEGRFILTVFEIVGVGNEIVPEPVIAIDEEVNEGILTAGPF